MLSDSEIFQALKGNGIDGHLLLSAIGRRTAIAEYMLDCMACDCHQDNNSLRCGIMDLGFIDEDGVNLKGLVFLRDHYKGTTEFL